MSEALKRNLSLALVGLVRRKRQVGFELFLDFKLFKSYRLWREKSASYALEIFKLNWIVKTCVSDLRGIIKDFSCQLKHSLKHDTHPYVLILRSFQVLPRWSIHVSAQQWRGFHRKNFFIRSITSEPNLELCNHLMQRFVRKSFSSGLTSSRTRMPVKCRQKLDVGTFPNFISLPSSCNIADTHELFPLSILLKLLRAGGTRSAKKKSQWRVWECKVLKKAFFNNSDRICRLEILIQVPRRLLLLLHLVSIVITQICYQ